VTTQAAPSIAPGGERGFITQYEQPVEEIMAQARQRHEQAVKDAESGFSSTAKKVALGVAVAGVAAAGAAAAGGFFANQERQDVVNDWIIDRVWGNQEDDIARVVQRFEEAGSSDARLQVYNDELARNRPSVWRDNMTDAMRRFEANRGHSPFEEGPAELAAAAKSHGAAS
jgi:hypothetical protein